MTKNPLVARGRLAALVAVAGLAFIPLAAAQTALPAPSFGQADTRQDRIEALEAQLREQTAETESIQRELIEARREIARLRGIVGDLTAANEAIPETPAQGAAPVAAPPPAAPPAATGARADPPATTTTPQQTGSLGTLSASQLPGDAGAAYSRARETLMRGNYAEAEVAFSEFLEAHADAATAPDARYWFAFTLLARNNFTDAAANFVTYLQAYPNGPRAPDAQVRLGIALAGMGQNRQACSAFNSLPRRYPRAPQAVRDLAQREAAALSCTAWTSALLDEATLQHVQELSPAAPILIALSGGGDSTALLHLMRERFGRERVAAIVIDHALREGSSTDAVRAAAFAEALGVRAEIITLTWPGGPKRAQASARQARHRALCAAANRHGARIIATGHTLDDQAETLLMRAAAQSSWRGLAGMRAIAPAPVWPEGRGLLVARPLLNARRTALRDDLRARGAAWIEDPSNQNVAFARVRVRERLAQLEAAGFDPMRLANLAAKLRPILDAIDEDAARLIADAARIEGGAISVDLSAWIGGVEARRRALSALLTAVSGAEREAGPDAVADLEAKLTSTFDGATLGGARLRRKAGALRIERDQGAVLGRAGGVEPLQSLALLADVETIWDGRLALVACEEGWSAAPAPGEGPVLTKSGASHSLAEATACGLVTARWLTKERIAHSLPVHPAVTGLVS